MVREDRERVGRGGERESRGDRATVQGKDKSMYMYTYSVHVYTYVRMGRESRTWL